MSREEIEEGLCTRSERALRVIRYLDMLARVQFWNGLVAESAASLARSYAAGTRVIRLETALLRRVTTPAREGRAWNN